MKKLLITGGCGFIGHHFVEHLLKTTDFYIIIMDKLNYASKGYDRLRSADMLNNKRISLFAIDLSQPVSVGIKYEIGEDIDYIVHMAAETHVDNSITDPVPFIYNNIMSTVHILEFARNLKKLKRFIYFSTDEVYGPALGNKLYKEDERHNPTNPYSASKSGAEQMCVAYHNTYKVPIIKINVMNAFGERQYVEKFIPKVIKKVLNNEKVYIHSYPDKKTSGTRYYIHARNISQAVLFILDRGKIGESYNVTGEKEVSNLELAQMIAKFMNKELKYEMVDFHSDRPGHDLRYGLDGSKIKELGWILPIDFEKSLEKTVLWTLQNEQWLEE